MGRFINRKDPDYHSRALELKTDADLVASIVLALNFTRRIKSQVKSTQGLIQNDCVAACFTPEGLWLAANSQSIREPEVAHLREELCDHEMDIYTVVNGKKNVMHAEMQLLHELLSEYTADDIRGLEMGVSKPCCTPCREELDKFGIRYSAYHNDKVVNWQKP